MKLLFGFLLSAAPLFSLAATLNLKDGRALEDYRVVDVKAGYVTVAYKGGLAKIDADLLPDDVLAQLEPRLTASPKASGAAGETAARDLALLRRRADAWLTNRDDTALRKATGDLSAYIDALLANNEADAAQPYLARVLKAYPWNFDYQLTYGEILARQGQPEELERRAEQALRHAEDDGTLRRAYRLMERAIPNEPPLLDRTSIGRAPLVLLQLGDVSAFWLYELRDALQAQLGIDVAVVRVDMELGPANRNLRKQVCAALRQRFLGEWNQDPGFGRYLESEGVSKHALATDDEVTIRVVRLFTQNRGEEAVKLLDQQLEVLRHAGLQWDASRILLGMEQALRSYNKARWSFLAVTSHDIYHGQSNFVFGLTARGAVGVISSARFRAQVPQESPRRQRLITRLRKQVLSSYGQILGVERCADPDCARANPSSLAEFDAKGDLLCVDCRAGFESALGRALPRSFDAY